LDTLRDTKIMDEKTEKELEKLIKEALTIFKRNK
jgi:hypothetical protein